MKKFLAICLVLTTLLGLIPTMALSAAAADIPGDWTTYRAASEYPENSDKPQKPEAGYKYTEDGREIPSVRLLDKSKHSITDASPHMCEVASDENT